MGKDAFNDHCWKDVIPEDLIELYRPYRRDTRIGAQSALVLIDLYNLAYQGGPRPPSELQDRYPSSCGIFAHSAIEPTERLLNICRAAGMPVFYSTKDLRDNAAPSGTRGTYRQPTLLNPAAYTIRKEFEPEPDDIIIFKQRASIFSGTPLLSHLTALRIDSLVICGESTSGCVRASCVDAFSAGYHVSLIEDCTFDRHELVHKFNLFDLHHKYVDVFGLDAFEAEILKSPEI